jgi:hypothetical protein
LDETGRAITRAGKVDEAGRCHEVGLAEASRTTCQDGGGAWRVLAGLIRADKLRGNEERARRILEKLESGLSLDEARSPVGRGRTLLAARTRWLDDASALWAIEAMARLVDLVQASGVADGDGAVAQEIEALAGGPAPS